MHSKIFIIYTEKGKPKWFSTEKVINECQSQQLKCWNYNVKSEKNVLKDRILGTSRTISKILIVMW